MIPIAALIQESRVVHILRLMGILEHMGQMEIQSMIMITMTMEDQTNTLTTLTEVITMIGRMELEGRRIILVGRLLLGVHW